MFSSVRKIVRLISKIRVSNLRLASTYEGDGKTTAMMLNRELDVLMINGFSSIGFRLNSGIRLFGPSIVFPRSCLSWNISSVTDINEQSLSLFKILCPKIDIIVLGYGDVKTLPHDAEVRIKNFSRTFGIGFEILPTEKAVSTFNYLVHEKRLVAAALIPPKYVKIYDDNDTANLATRQKLLAEE